jgi:hypothetical protein
LELFELTGLTSSPCARIMRRLQPDASCASAQ